MSSNVVEPEHLARTWHADTTVLKDGEKSYVLMEDATKLLEQYGILHESYATYVNDTSADIAQRIADLEASKTEVANLRNQLQEAKADTRVFRELLLKSSIPKQEEPGSVAQLRRLNLKNLSFPLFSGEETEISKIEDWVEEVEKLLNAAGTSPREWAEAASTALVRDAREWYFGAYSVNDEEGSFELLHPRHWQSFLKDFRKRWISPTARMQLHQDLNLLRVKLDKGVPQWAEFNSLFRKLVLRLGFEKFAEATALEEYTGYT
jgi:hypothetical protein